MTPPLQGQYVRHKSSCLIIVHLQSISNIYGIKVEKMCMTCYSVAERKESLHLGCPFIG